MDVADPHRVRNDVLFFVDTGLYFVESHWLTWFREEYIIEV